MRLAVAIGVCVAFYGLLFIFAGPVVLILVALGCFVACVLLLAWAASRPLSDVDRRLSRVDVEVARRERMVRRLARQRARERSPFRAGGGWRA